MAMIRFLITSTFFASNIEECNQSVLLINFTEEKQTILSLTLKDQMWIYDFFRMTIFLRIFTFQITFEKFDMSKIYFQTTAYLLHVMKTEKKNIFFWL